MHHNFCQASLEEGLEGQLGGLDFLTALPPSGWDKEKVVEEVLLSKMLMKVKVKEEKLMVVEYFNIHAAQNILFKGAKHVGTE